MPEPHDIYLRVYALPKDPEDRSKTNNWTDDDLKWPPHALIFDTESRITVDQSLTFGVYRLCQLQDENYVVTEEGLFYYDDLPSSDRDVLEMTCPPEISPLEM
jgi:hypothetical protein